MPPSKYRNLILNGLPLSSLRRLAPHLKKTRLPRGTTLTAPNRTIKYAYFLESGLASIVTTMVDGTSVEVAVVGYEGMGGIPIVLESASMPNRTFMQMGGTGYRLDASVLVAEYRRSKELRQKITHYVHAHLVQASQTAACNRLHEISKRLARWLLLCHDRIGSEPLTITHQSLSDMLGTPRPTVTLAARILQDRGAISYSRGHIEILDRTRLEKMACECYEAIRKESTRLGVL